MLANQVVAQLPDCKCQNIEELHRSSVFLLNFYYRQLQIEELSEVRFDLHVPFRLCLKVYVDVCRAWLSFSPSQLLAYHNCGFFIDLTRALSMDGDRFFDVSKMVNRQLVPDMFAPSYRRIVELGKTVQFIRLYFREESLMLFHKFLNVDEEFKPIGRILDPHGPHGLTQTQLSSPAQLTIS